MSSVSAELLERHFSEASFLWKLRDAAVRDPGYTMRNLGGLDERVDAHLDGLVLSGEPGWEACKAGLDEEEPGTVFTALFVATTQRDLRAVAHVLNVGAESPELLRAMVAALGWSSFKDLNRLLPGLLDPRCPTELHYLGIAACTAHRRDPKDRLTQALVSEAPLVRARALRAVGELGRTDLLDEVRKALAAEDPSVRFWAAWASSLFGDAEGERTLLRFASDASGLESRACETVMRRLAPAAACTWIESSAGVQDDRVTLAGAAALGDPALIPWVLDRMAVPALARIAGAAFHRITGLDFSSAKLRAKPPEGFASGPTDDPDDEEVAMDRDAALPWPNHALAEAWWKRRERDFRAGTRHLLGKPVASEAWLQQVLRSAAQPARAAAAEELSMMRQGQPLFEVRAPAARQKKGLQ
jgi:uncharacterized protein (TIGR02270 family)